ncbi:MAG: mechanosensitive ion channel domain-containing protein [Pseudomonadota bacterium]
MDPTNAADSMTEALLAWAAVQGVNILLALLLLVVGWWAIRLIKRLFMRWIERSDYMDPIVEQFLASLLYYGLFAVLLIAVLSLLGVQTTSLIAVLGAASLAIGLALQGSLTSLAAGVMIIILRPIRIGDYIEVNGEAGTVKTITLFMTELATYDNIQKLLPNSTVWGNTVTNYSIYSTRLLDVEVGIDYDDDIETALTLLRKIAEADERVLSDPAPNAFVDGMGESSVDLTLRVWVSASDYWPLKRALTKTVKEKIVSEGLSIPYPHRQILSVKGANDA